MVAPFFRFPGLFTTAHSEHLVRSRGIAAFGIDIGTYDWKRIGPQRMLQTRWSGWTAGAAAPS